MTTKTKTKENQKPAVTIEEIWENLKVTDQNENRFQFSTCRNRHIVVLGSNKTKNYIVGDIIRRDTYDRHYHPRRKEEQKTITYVMVYDDPSCNICVINLINIPPIEHFIRRIEKTSKDSSFTPMDDIDKTIHKFATCIDLIILVCEENDFELMINMKKWASNRGYILALAFIVKPTLNAEQREEFLLSIRQHEKFLNHDLGSLFDKGIFCISDLSYNDFSNSEEQNMAQNFVPEWRSKFLAKCVGSHGDINYKITLRDEKQIKKISFCKLS